MAKSPLLPQTFCLFVLAALLACDRGTPAPGEASSRFLDYHTKAELRLPFDGTWFVAWGGRTLGQNQHAVSRDQRFAVDLLVLDPRLRPSPGLVAEWSAGKSHRLDGNRNEHYYCYGMPILAPGDGQVIDVKDGLPENKPGKLEVDHPGNYLVIDHGSNEFSMMAHLKPGSIKVSVGERVVAGQQVAACGNSGRSSEPHLHYHLQNSPRWFDGEGLPAQFQGFEADGKPVQRGELRRGQLVKQTDAAIASDSFTGRFTTVTESACNSEITLSHDGKGKFVNTCRREDGSHTDDREVSELTWRRQGDKMIVTLNNKTEVLAYHDELSCRSFGYEGSANGVTGLGKNFWRHPINCK